MKTTIKANIFPKDDQDFPNKTTNALWWHQVAHIVQALNYIWCVQIVQHPIKMLCILLLHFTLLTHIIIKKWKRMIRFRTVGGYSFLRRGWRRRGGGGRAGGGREGGEGGGGLQRGALQLQAEVMGYCWRPRSSSDQPDVIEMDKNWNGYRQTSQPITLEAKWF